jgi:hypothetical protein
MKNILHSVIFGKDNKISGLIAFAIVGMIVLGCNCNKQIGSISNLDSKPSTSPTIFATPAATPKPVITKSDASKGEVPAEAEAQDIARTSLLDFNSALQSADFTTFHGNISRVWQRQTTPEKLKTLFQSFIDGKANISQISSLEAKFSPAPSIERTQGVKTLVLNGEYATTSIPTTFELKYIAEGKNWKLIAIKVYTAVHKN